MEAVGAIIGIADCTLRTTSKLWSVTSAWRDAPADLHRLRDDLSRTQRFFAETQEGINAMYALGSKVQGESHASWRELERLLDEGYAVLRQIEKFVDSLNRPSSGPSDESRELGKRRRIIWMTSVRKIQKLRDDLKGIVSNVCRLLIAQNVSASAEIFVSLERTHTGITSGIGTHVDAAAQQIASQTEKTIQAYQDATISRLGKVLELSQSAIIAQVERRLDEFGAKIAVPHLETEENVRWNVQRISITGLPQYQAESSYEKPSPYATQAKHPIPYSRVGSQLNPFKCDMSCLCECHRSAAFRWSMVSLRHVVGHMSVGYRGHSTQRCSLRACRYYHLKRRPARSVQLQYTFPDWLARISLSMFFSTNLNGSPQMVIRVLNRLHFKSIQPYGIFGRVRAGDIEGVKRILQEGSGSVYDVLDPSGASLLNEAMHEFDYEMVKFLLQAGADPYQQHLVGTGKGTSSMDHAVNLFVNHRRREGLALASLFPVADYIQDLEYPAISMIMMGILHMDLAEALRKPQYLAEINETGQGSLTPLAVAVTRGDIKAARLLIRAGADVNARFGTMKYTALHRACLYDDCDMVRLLLEAGADIDALDASSWTPLVFAAGTKYDITGIIAILLQYGADLCHIDRFGSQPLQRTALDRVPIKAQFLMDNGADVNHRDFEGEAVLVEAVLNGQPEMCKVFLSQPELDILNVNTSGMTILHNLARDADVATMRVFTEAKIQGLNPAARDKEGRTATMVFGQRKQTIELCGAFEELLGSVERGFCSGTIAEPLRVKEDDSEEEFFDAKEDFEAWGVSEKGHYSYRILQDGSTNEAESCK